MDGQAFKSSKRGGGGSEIGSHRRGKGVGSRAEGLWKKKKEQPSMIKKKKITISTTTV